MFIQSDRVVVDDPEANEDLQQAYADLLPDLWEEFPETCALGFDKCDLLEVGHLFCVDVLTRICFCISLCV